MKKNISLFSALLLCTLCVFPALGQTEPVAETAAKGETSNQGKNPRAAIETSKGKIVIELFADKAPLSVKNFLAYAEAGYYDGTVFHRVIPGFMIQGGGFDESLQKKSTQASIQNEADNGLLNTRGTLAMARTNAPHSATSQFFINVVDNDFLNHRAKNARGWGYAVFAKVIEGMDVADAIAAVKTGNKNRMQNVPVENVVIEKVSRIAE